MVNGDKEIFSNLGKYDKELEMMESYLINPRVDNDDFLMFDSSIRKIQVENIGLSCNLVDRNRESRGQQQFQEKKMQVYQSKDILDMEIEELSLLMLKMSQRRHADLH